MANEGNLGFKITADSSQAQGEVDDFRRKVGTNLNVVKGDFGKFGAAVKKEMNDVAQSLADNTGALGRMAAGLGTTGLALAATAGAAVGAGAAVFALTKKASDAGSEIFEFAQRTNLSAEFLSALKVQAEQSGSSLSAAAANVTKFSNSLVDAARGNKELTADLKRFDIDATTAYRNTEASVRAFIERFNQLPASAANNEAAMRLFKDRTGAVIPVLRSFGTDIDGLMERLGEMGLLWDREGTEKADEFGDALTELGQIASGMGNVFAREVMPDITNAMREISKSVVENKAAFKEWGATLGDTMRGVREVADSNLGAVVGWLAKVAIYTNPLVMLGGHIKQLGTQARDAEAVKNFGPLGARGVATPLTAGTAASSSAADITNEAAARQAETTRKRAMADAERARKAELRAIEKSEEEKVNIFRRALDKVLDMNREVQRQIEDARRDSAQADREWAERVADAADAVRTAMREQLEAILGTQTELEKVNRIITRAEILNAIDAQTKAWLRTLAVINDVGKEIERIGITPDALRGLGDLAVPIPTGEGPLVDPKGLEAPPPPNFDGWKSAIGELKEMAVGAFGDMAGALGEMVGQWVLYGAQAQVSARKMIASVLASVATQAAIQSVYEAAIGIAAMTPWGLAIYGSPIQHFKAAALLAGVAAAAGLAGRAVAGNSFAGAGGGGGGAFGGGTQEGQREDNRTKYMREQDEKNKNTRREDRRGEMTIVHPIIIEGREVFRAVVNYARDGGSETDMLANALRGKA